jgi:hypothetical protein
MRTDLHRAITGMLLGWGLLAVSGSAAEPPPPPAATPAVKIPAHQKAMAAAAERWKMKRAVKRMKRPGATGQHDLFWEILGLWEKQEKSRADADLVASMDWLLFEARLWKDPDLASAAAKRIPNLVPALGQKLIVARLEAWVGRQASRYSGNEPWRWREFQGKNRKHLGTAAEQLLKTGPKHNPLTRIWMAAALLAGEGPGAEKEFASTWKLLHDRLPSRAPGLTQRVALSLANGGVKGGLKLLLDVAQDELDRRARAAKPGAAGTGRPIRSRHYARPSSRFWPVTLTRFYSLAGWLPPTRSQYTDSRARASITTSRKWLKGNLTKLSWEIKTGRFTGGAPQPGMEKFFKAAAALKAKYGFNGADQMVSRGIAPSGALNNLLALIAAKPGLARDENLGPVAEVLVERSGETIFHTSSRSGESLFARLARLPAPLGVNIYAAAFGQALRSTRQYSTSRLSLAARADPAVLQAACLKLKPEMKKDYQAALKGTDSGAKLEAGLRYLFVGGEVPQSRLSELVKNATASSYSKRAHVKTWMDYMINAGMARGLRLCLALAQAESTTGGTSYMRTFGKYVGWYKSNQYRFPNAKSELAKALKWLPANEARLKWNKAARNFSGASAPGAEALLKHAAEIEKRWGLEVRAAAGDGRDGARKLFSEIVAIGLKRPAAGKDPKLMALLECVIEIGQVKTDTLLKKKLMVEVPKFSPEVASKQWAKYLRENLTGAGRYRSSPSTLTSRALEREYPDLNRAVMPTACKLLRPEMKKAWKDSAKDKIDERIRKGLAYVAVGGTLKEIKFEALLKEAEKLGSTTRLGLRTWGPAIAAMGNLDGLKLMLIYAERTRQSAAYSVSRYLYLVGKTKDRFGRDVFRLDKAKLAQRIKREKRWLEANRKNLAFDLKTGRFKLTGKEIKLPDDGGKKDPGPDVF